MPSDEETDAAVEDEARRARELRTSVDLACAVLRQGRPSRAEAEKIVAATRRQALRLFPGKGHVFDLVLAPRFRRIIEEVWPAADVLSFPGGSSS